MQDIIKISLKEDDNVVVDIPCDEKGKVKASAIILGVMERNEDMFDIIATSALTFISRCMSDEEIIGFIKAVKESDLIGYINDTNKNNVS